ncbi:NADH ubiquinone oxidoreductase chain A [Thermogutta terrifontis]|uniref:NADH-quinone oxidoreductase subunit n=1 Tax=Thermogutta terrifontis TaxID=1331910 RepID=A0A286RE96_9BACT|nr:NADH-quinone oxidoreductase subunit A [Thermogutta terrifontis]ASV74280.1 NADH ubiquinone oxidoreductase chain A [Thermogutta terrifontis]
MPSAFLVGYLLLFMGAAVAVVFGGLLLGKLLRPHRPTAEKLQTYECGEPAVGPADVQFDLRFYVVALVFLIFDVEVAVFFPWAVVFGKASHLRSASASDQALEARLAELGFGHAAGQTPSDRSRVEEGKSTSVPRSESIPSSRGEDRKAIRKFGNRLMWMALVDVLIFFGILLVGFAYLWHRGDLEWVRALPEGTASPPEDRPQKAESLSVLVGET